MGILQPSYTRIAIQPGLPFRFNWHKVRAVRPDVRRLGVIEPIIGIMHRPAVRGEGQVGHVAEGSTGVFNKIVQGFQLADEADGGGQYPQGGQCFGGGWRVMVAAVADAGFLPVVGEVQDGIDGAGDAGPNHVHPTWKEAAAEVADVDADVGLEFWFDVNGEGFKAPARCLGGDVAGAGEEFEEKGFWLGGPYVENVRKSGHVGIADPGCFLIDAVADECHFAVVALGAAKGAGVSPGGLHVQALQRSSSTQWQGEPVFLMQRLQSSSVQPQARQVRTASRMRVPQNGQ